MPKKLTAQRRTHPLWWCAALLCMILTVAIIFGGIAVFIGYLVIHPRVPILSVIDAHLDLFQYDYAGTLVTQVSVVVRSENDNLKAHSSFSDLQLRLIFEGMHIASLQAGDYDVRKNSTVDFNFVVVSRPIPLSPAQSMDVDVMLKQDQVRFDLQGNARARWRVGLLGSIRFWCHLNCKLNFRQSNGSYVPSPCTSRAK
ncbi:unnamed protein product [Linum tenue]|uniref:Late embryogenesis abundant protein LEA-2 subgroup domain-containing protein n=2 Tax=Linum TaxID=4005 RepID=A0AAV0JK54_9ROSI|nr:unnamed protein product [Linum tenue]